MPDLTQRQYKQLRDMTDATPTPPGPRIAEGTRERLARYLWIADAGDARMWDRNQHIDREPYYAQADEILDIVMGPARDDLIIIRAWNSDAVCDEKIIAFNYGPQGGADRLARHLYLADCGDDSLTVEHWDLGKVSDGTYRKYLRRAEAAIRAYEGREG